MKRLFALFALAVAVCCIPLSALAEISPPPAAPDAVVLSAAPSPVSQLLNELLKVAVLAIVSVGVAALAAARKHIEAKAAEAEARGEQAKLARIGSRAVFVVESVVADLNATVKERLPQYLKDGTLSAEEMAELRAECLRRVKLVLGTTGIEELKGAFGIAAEALPTFLGGLVEKAVDTVKLASAPVAPPIFAVQPGPVLVPAGFQAAPAL